MQTQLDIPFNQLVQLVQSLPSDKLKQLKEEIEKEVKAAKSSNLEELLLNGPTATSRQPDIVSNNRKAINQWLTKCKCSYKIRFIWVRRNGI